MNKELKFQKPFKRGCTIGGIIGRIFNRWTKWEVYQSDKIYTRTQVNNITGSESRPQRVYCDVMKKTNKYTGMVKYKTVVKG
tara:strand:+ start:76 stop:321 length:246 start_codon:yes stop_codon:yes gene_type:complete